MDDELKALLRDAAVDVEAGMRTNAGRVLSPRVDTALVWDAHEGVREVSRVGLVPDVTDRATYLLCLEQLGRRVGLDPQPGLLWYLDEDRGSGEGTWVLEGTDEVRTRDGDTDDPALSLARALTETTTEAVPVGKG